MKVMAIVKASRDSEAGKMPGEELLAAMGRFNEEMAEAGILRDGDGLRPSSEGVRIGFGRGERTVTPGPFPEPEQLIAGFWLLEVDSMEQAVEWIKRCPDPHPGGGEIELRPIFEAEDFGDEATPAGDERADRGH